MKNRLFASLIIVAACLPAFSSPRAGRKAGASLASQVGVRASAMGGAFTAIADDVTALYSNPAGLGRLSDIEVTAFSQQLNQDASHRHVALAIPFGDASASNIKSGFGTLAGSIEQFDYGTLEGRDATGNATSNFQGRDLLWSVGYGKGWADRFFLGLAMKRYKMRLDTEDTSGTVFDLGMLARPMPRWTVGVAVKNEGNKLKFISEDEKLPRKLAVGLGYEPVKNILTFAFDVEKPQDDVSHGKFGVEYWVNKTVAFRAGYDSDASLNGSFTAGLGLRLLDFEAGFFPIKTLSVDYAFIPGDSVSGISGDSIENRHNFSLSMRFGDR